MGHISESMMARGKIISDSVSPYILHPDSLISIGLSNFPTSQRLN